MEFGFNELATTSRVNSSAVASDNRRSRYDVLSFMSELMDQETMRSDAWFSPVDVSSLIRLSVALSVLLHAAINEISVLEATSEKKVCPRNVLFRSLPVNWSSVCSYVEPR